MYGPIVLKEKSDSQISIRSVLSKEHRKYLQLKWIFPILIEHNSHAQTSAVGREMWQEKTIS